MEPIKRFSPEQYEQALASWSWLDLAGKTPQFASLFGDLFLESPEGWWYLDTIEGDLKRVWQTDADVQAAQGGELDADNASALDFVVAVDLAGQIHDQVRNLPPGTPISAININ